MGDFSQIRKCLKMGVLGNFQKPVWNKCWALGGLGPVNNAKNFAGGFRDIVKTNFPEISFPPPGGNRFPARSKK